MKCRYSHRGTFGHECGRPATLAGAKPSPERPGGVFWSHRCDRCASECGADNWGVKAWEPIDPARHANRPG